MSNKTTVTLLVRGGVVETAFVKGGAVRVNVIDCDTQEEADFDQLEGKIEHATRTACYTTNVGDYDPAEEGEYQPDIEDQFMAAMGRVELMPARAISGYEAGLIARELHLAYQRWRDGDPTAAARAVHDAQTLVAGHADAHTLAEDLKIMLDGLHTNLIDRGACGEMQAAAS